MSGAGLPHADLAALARAYDDLARDARALVSDLSEAGGAWRPSPGAWSVAECLDHLATANRVYLASMREAAERARARGFRRRGPALPGLVGGWFVRSLEPPVKPGPKPKAPAAIRPRRAPPLDDAARAFLASLDDVQAFLREFAAVDLAGVRFRNPFVPLVRFSLATGLHVIAAHTRRHLWQARRVREAMRRAGASTDAAVGA